MGEMWEYDMWVIGYVRSSAASVSVQLIDVHLAALVISFGELERQSMTMELRPSVNLNLPIHHFAEANFALSVSFSVAV
jgi:hypothetical protein